MLEPPTYRRLHAATILMQIIANARVLFAMIIALVLSMLGGGSRSAKGEFLLNGMAAFFAIAAIVPALFRYLTVRYTIADGAFVLRSGLMFRQVRTIPLERIQNINVKRNLLQRVLGVATLQIETASGRGIEAELAVVSNAEAGRLTEALRGISVQESEEELNRDLVYAATPGQLFFAGATQNRAGHIVAFFIGLIQYVDDILRGVLGRTTRMSGPLLQFLPGATTVVLMGTVGLVLLLMSGWFLSVVGSFIGDFGFTLRTSGGLLRLRHGMFTQLESTVPVRRVQALRFDSPLIQRWLGYCQVYAESAGSYMDKAAGGSAKLCPLLERSSAEELGRLVFPTLRLDDIPWLQVSPLSIRRGFTRALIWWMFFIGAGAFSLSHWMWLLIPVAIVHAGWVARMRYRVLGYAREDGFVYIRSGVWRLRLVVVPEDRIQAATVFQSPFQRRWSLANLIVVTAGATLHARAEIPDLPVEVALALQDELMARSPAVPVGGL